MRKGFFMSRLGFGGAKRTPFPSINLLKQPSQSEGLSSDLPSVPEQTHLVPLPPPPPPLQDNPETWLADLEAKVRILEEEGKKRILADYLRWLALFLAEETELWAIIQTLEDELTSLEADLSTRPMDQKDQIQCAIHTVKDLLSKYRARRVSVKRP